MVYFLQAGVLFSIENTLFWLFCLFCREFMHLLVYLCRSKNYGGVLKWTNMRYGKSSDTSPPIPPSPRKKMPITIWKRVRHTIRAHIYLHAPIRIMPKYTRHFSKRGFPPWLVGWWWWGRAGNCSDKANLPYKEVKSNRPLLMSSSFWSLSVAVLLQLSTN